MFSLSPTAYTNTDISGPISPRTCLARYRAHSTNGRIVGVAVFGTAPQVLRHFYLMWIDHGRSFFLHP